LTGLRSPGRPRLRWLGSTAAALAQVDCGYARPVEWALPEWTVLAVLRERPAHGFAIAALTTRGGELGRVWQIPRPVVYRALSRLSAADLVAPQEVESAAGPPRTVYAITPSGRTAVDAWLTEPVRHVRELRSHLLMKLALLDRRGLPLAPLVSAQRTALAPLLTAVAADREEAAGFDAVLLSWRHGNVLAALHFLDEVSG
jgi:PadR family transcriptional regulator AphA